MGVGGGGGEVKDGPRLQLAIANKSRHTPKGKDIQAILCDSGHYL